VERELGSILQEAVEVKITALAPFPFVGAQFGGGERIYNLLSRVENEIDVLIPTFGEPQRMRHNNLTLTALPLPHYVRHKEWDLAVIEGTPETFKSVLGIIEPDLIILEHPWQVEAIQTQRFVYDAHNNETRIKQLIGGPEIQEATARVEKIALQADHVTYCSTEDEIQSDSPMTLIPNGVNLPPEVNTKGFGSDILLFVGSGHPPNIGAAMALASIAEFLPDYQIVIAGQCSQFIRSNQPNVKLLGHVEPSTLHQLFLSDHAFVNLMGAGSGTSLKVIKAISYGLPVISTIVGARGYSTGCLIARTPQEVTEWLDKLKTPLQYKSVSESNLELAKGYSWDVIGKRFNETVFSVV
jgi:glycosyltransferase involved in cell wall biosynthesis